MSVQMNGFEISDIEVLTGRVHFFLVGGRNRGMDIGETAVAKSDHPSLVPGDQGTIVSANRGLIYGFEVGNGQLAFMPEFSLDPVGGDTGPQDSPYTQYTAPNETMSAQIGVPTVALPTLPPQNSPMAPHPGTEPPQQPFQPQMGNQLQSKISHPKVTKGTQGIIRTAETTDYYGFAVPDGLVFLPQQGLTYIDQDPDPEHLPGTGTNLAAWLAQMTALLEAIK